MYVRRCFVGTLCWYQILSCTTHGNNIPIRLDKYRNAFWLSLLYTLLLVVLTQLDQLLIL
jgi:hypothetical protein